MEQKEFYTVNGCEWFIPVKLIEIEEDKYTKTLEVVATESGRTTFVPTVYKFRKPSEPQKVVVPKFVAEWIEEAKEGECSLCTAFGLVDGDSRNFDWLFNGDKSNQDTFARAWLDGYETEQEPLYTVEIPNPNAKGINKFYLCKADNTGKVYLCKGNFNPKKNKNLRLTEAEIRKDFEWAWHWKKEVTE